MCSCIACTPDSAASKPAEKLQDTSLGRTRRGPRSRRGAGADRAQGCGRCARRDRRQGGAALLPRLTEGQSDHGRSRWTACDDGRLQHDGAGPQELARVAGVVAGDGDHLALGHALVPPAGFGLPSPDPTHPHQTGSPRTSRCYSSCCATTRSTRSSPSACRSPRLVALTRCLRARRPRASSCSCRKRWRANCP
jgi:hypothetical protein